MIAGITTTAGAATGGTGGGGITVPKPPEAADATCLSACVGLRQATVGGTVEVVGKRLENVVAVKFKGGDGPISAKARSARKTRVTATVPKGARRGKLKVVDGFGGRSKTEEKLGIKPASAIEEVGKFSLDQVSVSPRKAYFDGPKKPTVNYLFKADEAADIRVDVVRAGSGETVTSIVKRDQEPFENQEVSWDGKRESGGDAPDGKYRLRVGPISGGGSSGGQGSEFGFYSHKFPIRGKHYYGDGLGAGRNHMGQDVFAKCRTKLVAARGGRVEVRAYHASAGYYLVVDGRKTNRDYFYAHMLKRGRAGKGERVKTGEQIGYVSDTGNASGCHLHFELWKKEWFSGKLLNPTPQLKKWDKWS